MFIRDCNLLLDESARELNLFHLFTSTNIVLHDTKTSVISFAKIIYNILFDSLEIKVAKDNNIYIICDCNDTRNNIYDTFMQMIADGKYEALISAKNDGRNFTFNNNIDVDLQVLDSNSADNDYFQGRNISIFIYPIQYIDEDVFPKVILPLTFSISFNLFIVSTSRYANSEPINYLNRLANPTD